MKPLSSSLMGASCSSSCLPGSAVSATLFFSSAARERLGALAGLGLLLLVQGLLLARFRGQPGQRGPLVLHSLGCWHCVLFVFGVRVAEDCAHVCTSLGIPADCFRPFVIVQRVLQLCGGLLRRLARHLLGLLVGPHAADPLVDLGLGCAGRRRQESSGRRNTGVPHALRGSAKYALRSTPGRLSRGAAASGRIGRLPSIDSAPTLGEGGEGSAAPGEAQLPAAAARSLRRPTPTLRRPGACAALGHGVIGPPLAGSPYPGTSTP
eukprot:scaffold1626_cov372-Prasinococcus_capsulatus_cf.AAC.17